MNFFSILYAVLAVGALGLLFGAGLAIASRFFNAEADQRIGIISELLPGSNCTACGYPGCESYAAALVKGARINACMVCKDSTRSEIAKILGKDLEDLDRFVAIVQCCGGDKSEKRFDYTGISDCYAALNVGGSNLVCSHGCLGYGTCKAGCKYGAITIKNGVANINKKKCTGCMMCVKTCPRSIIKMVPLSSDVCVLCASTDPGGVARKYCQNGCIGCRICEKECPEQAITVADNLAQVDYTKCINCGLCAEKCPAKCILNISIA